MTIHSETGEVIGKLYHSVPENIYWNSKLVSSSGYGNAPDKWFTQGGNVTITSENPYYKGFSTQYTNTQSGSHVTDIEDATPSAPHWKGVYTTFSGATATSSNSTRSFGGVQNSTIQGGWESGEGAIMKMVYDGSGASNSTNAVRAYIWKNYFSDGAIEYRQSFFYFIDSGEFSSGYFAGYAGQYGSTTADASSRTGQHRYTNLGATDGGWTYVNHAAGSYLGATANNASQNYLNAFGFKPGTSATVWIAIPALTAQMRSSGKSVNIAAYNQHIGQG